MGERENKGERVHGSNSQAEERARQKLAERIVRIIEQHPHARYGMVRDMIDMLTADQMLDLCDLALLRELGNGKRD